MSRNIPSKYKIRASQGKYIWREIIQDKVPKEILERPKTGFAIPLYRLMKKELKGVVENIILKKDSYIYENFSYEAANKMWQDHVDGRADYSNHIWSLIMLELWIKKYIKKSSTGQEILKRQVVEKIFRNFFGST